LSVTGQIARPASAIVGLVSTGVANAVAMLSFGSNAPSFAHVNGPESIAASNIASPPSPSMPPSGREPCASHAARRTIHAARMGRVISAAALVVDGACWQPPSVLVPVRCVTCGGANLVVLALVDLDRQVGDRKGLQHRLAIELDLARRPR